MKIINKEYKDFKTFTLEAQRYLKLISDKNIAPKEAIAFARNFLDQKILNSYYRVGILSRECKNMLESKTFEIKFSMDSLIKNRINHPDINFSDYNKINDIISNPDEVKLSKNGKNCILLLKKYEKKYQLVIKTTKNKNENYLTSFRLAQH